MRFQYSFYLALIVGTCCIAASSAAHAQLTENVNECGALERHSSQNQPLSKSERIAQRQQEINDLVDQVETCSSQSGDGAGGSGSSDGSSSSGSSNGSNGEGFNNTLDEGESSVASNTLKGNETLIEEPTQEPLGVPDDSYALDSGTQEPSSGNGAKQEALKKVDNNERLRRQLEAKIESEQDPAVKAALKEKLKNLKK